MIVVLAQAVCEQIAALRKQDRIERDKRDIGDTCGELEQIVSQLKRLSALFRLVRDRFDADQVGYVIDEARQVEQDLALSQERFAQERRQVKCLQEVQERLRKLEQTVNAGWKDYATKQVAPLFRLAELVGQLPETRTRLSVMMQLEEDLKGFAENPPSTETDLGRFDEHIHKLSDCLSQLGIQNDSVKDFLERVCEGTATLGDLSDEILAWCRQGERAGAFKITFG